MHNSIVFKSSDSMFVEIPVFQKTLLTKPSAVPSPIWHQAAAADLTMSPLLCCPYTMLHWHGRSCVLMEVDVQVEMSLCDQKMTPLCGC